MVLILTHFRAEIFKNRNKKTDKFTNRKNSYCSEKLKQGEGG